MERVHKSAIEFEVKSMADGEVQKGIIEGYAAHFGNVDRQGDILVKGSLQAKQVRVPMFWNHNQNIVVGSAVVWEDAKGFRFRGEFALNSESEDVRRDALKAYALAKDGHVTKNSFGYIIHDKEYKHVEGYDRPIRFLKKVELFEVSLVPVPANNMAEVTSVKNYDPEAKQKAASGSTSLPLADRGRAWDADAAVRRVREWAGGPDKESINWSKYRQAFFWYDANNPEDFGSYKLPFADVINGRLVAVPRGIFAAAAAMQGARGGVNIPEGDRAAVRRKIAAYYRKMGETPPWSETEEKSAEPLIDRKLRRLIRSGYLWV